MKKLYILRHAKAAHNTKIDDHERPLTLEGLENCARVADYLTKERIAPEHVMCSTAIRTRDTIATIAESYPFPSPIYLPQLYLASAGEIFRIIGQIDDSITSVLLCGHNGGLHEFAALLAGSEARPGLLAQLRTPLPTSALVAVECATSHWQEVEVGSGSITGFYDPSLPAF